MRKPREYWINDNAEGDGAFEVSRTPWFGSIHVIEKTAYDHAIKQMKWALALSLNRGEYNGLMCIKKCLMDLGEWKDADNLNESSKGDNT